MWDSMGAPQMWGDGSEFGEEWSSMHMRFRSGLQKMVDWYRLHELPKKQYDHQSRHQYYSQHSHSHLHHHENRKLPQEDDDDAADTALVIITHGAGCNALVAALSKQPALLDIGTASLTMAVRKDLVEESSSAFREDHHDQPRTDLPVSHEYDLKVMASSDHLRPGVDPIQLPVSPASPKLPPSRPLSLSSYRRRPGTVTPLANGHFIMVGSDREGRGRHQSASPRSSPGLWGSTSIASDRASGEDALPNFADLHRTKSVESESSASSGNELWTKSIPQRSVSQRGAGLWGSGGPTDEAARRRFTVGERR